MKLKQQWVLHNDGRVGVISDCPKWLNFDEEPPRGVYVNWGDGEWREGFSSTKVLTPISKSVSDILNAVNTNERE